MFYHSTLLRTKIFRFRNWCVIQEIVGVVVLLFLLSCSSSCCCCCCWPTQKTWHVFAVVVVANFEKYIFSFFGDHSINANTNFEENIRKNTTLQIQPINVPFHYYFSSNIVNDWMAMGSNFAFSKVYRFKAIILS